MNDVNSLITIAEYGKVHIKLKQVMEEKGITRNHLADVSGTRFEVINRWYHDNIAKLDLDVLARICYVLNCVPEDIISYEKPVLKQTAVK